MNRSHLVRLLQHAKRLETPEEQEANSDAHLLARFSLERDQDAFAELVFRYGPLVRRVCARVLHDPGGIDDAFQATFLVLARRAGNLRHPERLAGWLHGVAWKVARKAAIQQGRAPRSLTGLAHEPADERSDPLAQLSARDLLQAIDEEMDRLPERYRLPVLLCCLEGLTLDEAAARLGWTRGSVKGRLERGRQRLHAQLTRRGLSLQGTLAAVESSRMLGGMVSASAGQHLAQLACDFAVSGAKGLGIAPRTLTLTHEVIKTMSTSRFVCTLALVVMLSGTLALTSLLALSGTPGTQVRQTPSRTRVSDVAEPPAALQARDLPLKAEGLLAVTVLAFSADSKTLLTGGLSGWEENAPGVVVAWDRASGKRQGAARRLAAGLAPAEFSADHKRMLVMRGATEDLRVVEWATGKEVRLGEHKFAHIQTISPDGSAVMSNSAAAIAKKLFSELKVWDAATGKLRFRLDNTGDDQTKVFYSTVFSPDGKKILAARGDGAMLLLDAGTGQEVAQLGNLPRKGLPRVIGDATGKRAVGWTSESKEFTLVDVAGRKAVLRKGHQGVIRTAAFFPDGKRLVTCDDEATLHVWNLTAERPEKTLVSKNRNNRETAQEIHITADGRWVALTTIDEGGFTWVWDLKTGTEVASYAGAEHAVFSPDGRMLALRVAGQMRLGGNVVEKPTGDRVKLIPVRDWETAKKAEPR